MSKIEEKIENTKETFMNQYYANYDKKIYIAIIYARWNYTYFATFITAAAWNSFI